MTQWHVFYRTKGMAARNEKGWQRSDFLSDTAQGALVQLMQTKEVLHARVYPGAVAYTVRVDWHPTINVRHEPHRASESVERSAE